MEVTKVTVKWKPVSSSEKERIRYSKTSNKNGAVNLLNISGKTTTFTMFLLTARWEKRIKAANCIIHYDPNIFQNNCNDHFSIQTERECVQ